jgi:hypothetical protein
MMRGDAMRFQTAMVLVLAVALGVSPTDARADECSTAIVSGAASVDGCPILWKNRDTDHLANKVVFVAETPYSYLGLADADDASGRRVFLGLNSAGFAIMNTVAYNLPKAAGDAEDLEGTIMADALRLCRTVDDFERYIAANSGRSLGSQANFGAIDAAGGAAVFEVHNRGYQRMQAADQPERYLLVTNFSRSGEADKGRGYVRFDRLVELFRGDEDGKYSFDQILGSFTRDLQNPYLSRLEPSARAKLPAERPYFVYTQQTIDRRSTSSAVVFHGVAPGADPRNATMWVILGEPVCGVAVPLWVEAGGVPPELRGGATAPINQESLRLKAILRPYRDDERAEYLDLAKLENRGGSGWLPVLVRKEKEVVERTKRFLATNPGAAEKARFQQEVAAEVLKTLEGIK